MTYKTGDRDLEFLEDLSNKSLGIVAEKWAPIMGWELINASNNAGQWLDRIRDRLVKYQTYVNRIRALQRKSPRIRKLTTSGKIDREEEELTIE